MEGVRNVSWEYREVAYILEKKTVTTLRKVILPAAIPGILTGLRLGISNAWRAVVTAEMLSASSGLGYMINYAREMAQPALVLIGVFSIGVVGFLLDFILKSVQKGLLRWM